MLLKNEGWEFQVSFPNIPNVTASITISRKQAANLLFASIAFEELGISHIINAEGEKIQFALGLIPGLTHAPTITELLDINRSVRKTLDSVIRKELILESKLQSVVEIFLNEDECAGY